MSSGHRREICSCYMHTHKNQNVQMIFSCVIIKFFLEAFTSIWRNKETKSHCLNSTHRDAAHPGLDILINRANLNHKHM
jgi:hypothetical protein